MALRMDDVVRSRPYIGMAGIKNTDEVIRISEFVSEFSAVIANMRVQIGVQVSPKVINGLDCGGNLRLPANLFEVRRIFEQSIIRIPNVFNVVHYHDNDKSKMIERVSEMFGYTRIFEEGLCQGIQFNGFLSHLDYRIIRSLMSEFPGLEVILQINMGDIGDFSENQINSIIQKIIPISEFISYTFIDGSGGEGIPMDIGKSAYLALRINRALPNMAIGFAGGINDDNVEFIVRKLAQELRDDNFSIDCESGIRDKIGEGYGNDIFNPEKAERFFCNAIKAFGFGGLSE